MGQAATASELSVDSVPCSGSRPTEIAECPLLYFASCAGLFEQLLEDFAGLGARNGVVGDDERGHRGDSTRPGMVPVDVDGFAIPPGCQHVTAGCFLQADAGCNLHKTVDRSNVDPVDKIRAKQTVVNCLPARLRDGVCGKFLSKAAVIRHGAIGIRQAFGIHQSLHAGLRC